MSDSHEIDTIARYWVDEVGGDLSPADWLRFKTWFAGDPRHRIAFLRVHALKTHEDRLDALQCSASPEYFNTSQWAIDGLGEVSRKRSAVGKGEPAKRWSAKSCPRAHPPIAPLRATLILSLFVRCGLGVLPNPHLTNPFLSDWCSYSTPVGSHNTVRLTDNTSIELNTDTRLRTRHVVNDREIVLERGEAFFKVPHDATRPFKVIVDRLEILDLGTSFDVYRRRDDTISISILEGRVRVRRAGDADQDTAALSTELTAGDVATIGQSVVIERVPLDKLECRLSWRNGVLCFHNESLMSIVQELNRYNNQHIAIADSSIMNIRIGGSYSATDPAGIVRSLGEMCLVRRMPSRGGDDSIRIGAHTPNESCPH